MLTLLAVPLAAVEGDVLDKLLGYGILGIVTVLWLIGFICRGADRDRAYKERDDAIAYARSIEEKTRTDVIPALVANTAAVAEQVRIVARASAIIEQFDNRPRPRPPREGK